MSRATLLLVAALGDTLPAATAAFAINKTRHARPGYGVGRDFAAVAPWATSPMVPVVTPALPVTTLAELVADARANPGRITHAGGGVGPITPVGQALPETRATFAPPGAQAFASDAAAHDRFLHAEVARRGAVIRAADIRVA
jgi:hypothetical protein